MSMSEYTVLEPVELPPKTPFDEVPYTLDFIDVLPVGDTVASGVVTVFLDDEDMDIDSPTDIPAMHAGAAVASGTSLQQKTTGGTSDLRYRIRMAVTTTAGWKFERDGKFLVGRR
jgi:hypothetical protein